MQTSEILVANEIYHDQEADAYDASQPFIRNSFAQRYFEKDITELLHKTAYTSRPVRVLDCGAGTGNLTMKFLARGCHVTAVDISRNMLARLSQKARQLGSGELTPIHQDVDSFLAHNQETFDIVTSCSFLHHLPDYRVTYRAMTRACNEFGIIYTAFEPTVSTHFNLGTRLLIAIDSAYHRFRARQFYNPAVITRAVLRKAGIAKETSQPTRVDPSLVERPDLGVDLPLLESILRESGFDHIYATRRPVLRHGFTFAIAKHIFKLENAMFLAGQRSTSADNTVRLDGRKA